MKSFRTQFKMAESRWWTFWNVMFLCDSLKPRMCRIDTFSYRTWSEGVLFSFQSEIDWLASAYGGAQGKARKPLISRQNVEFSSAASAPDVRGSAAQTQHLDAEYSQLHVFGQEITISWLERLTDLLIYRIRLPYQTDCPQMRTFALQWSWHGVYATTLAQKYHVLIKINMDNRPRRMPCPPRRFVKEFCQLRENKDGESGTNTQNSQGFVWCGGCRSGCDAKMPKNSFRGIQSRIRWMAWLQYPK